MIKTVKLSDKEYDTESLSDGGKETLKRIQFADERLKELRNLHAFLQRAKNSYIDALKKEILQTKAGFDFSGD